MTAPTEEHPELALRCSIARFTDLFNADVAEQMDVTWDRVLTWLEAKPTKRWNDRCPGWSPVVYEPARRAKENIRSVFGLVLDYDKEATLDAVIALWGNFYGLTYTTKSHDVGHHRMRVVLPLNRSVNADEYDKLWIWADRTSKRAELPLDGQCKDASRFWYVPTLPDGDEWRAIRLHGEVLDVDATLPTVDVPQLAVVRAPAPLTTDDRVKRARAYLAKIPPGVSGDRGHTQTFNAVAHVMFGFDLDSDSTYSLIANDYNPRCDPPWSEKELRHKIKSVAEKCKRPRGYLLKERTPIYSTQHAAQSAPPIDQEHNVDWRTLLITDHKGKIKRGYNNVLAFVRHHPDYWGKWSLNTMTSEVCFESTPIRDTFTHDVRAHADRLLGFSPSRDDVDAAILTSAQDRQFHPIQQYLRSVDWDGTPRLAAMASAYLGSDSALHSEMVRRWMIGAVARALSPGCKLDTALMLYGQQGIFKSTFFAILGGAWHADSPIDIQNKDAFQQIHAAWIYEFSELENVVTGARESRLKAFLSATHDTYRAPYARSVLRRARSVAICGTTNRDQILTDDTGSRRFWIVPVAGPIPREMLSANRDQLWAEAVCAYEAGESWWLDGDLDRQREESNLAFEDNDPWQETICEYLASPSIRETTVAAILRDALKLDAARQDRWAQMRVSRVLRILGWTRRQCRTGAGRQWRYMRPEAS